MIITTIIIINVVSKQLCSTQETKHLIRLKVKKTLQMEKYLLVAEEKTTTSASNPQVLMKNHLF